MEEQRHAVDGTFNTFPTIRCHGKNVQLLNSALYHTLKLSTQLSMARRYLGCVARTTPQKSFKYWNTRFHIFEGPVNKNIRAYILVSYDGCVVTNVIF